MHVSLFAMAKPLPHNYVAFYRPLRSYTTESQRAIVCSWLDQNGGKLVAEYTAGEHGDDLIEWQRRTRSTEGAIVADLWAIPEMRRDGTRPTSIYSATLAALAATCAVIVEARTGITSRDGAKWRAAVEAGANKVASGRERPRGHAKKMARARWAKAAPGIVEEWLSPNMASEREQWQNHWCNRKKYRSAQAAFDAFPAKLQQEFASTRTAYRIFGPRDPDRESGGKPAHNKQRR